MKANDAFLNMPLEFWANVRLISQNIGYTAKGGQVKVHTIDEIISEYKALNLNTTYFINDGTLTESGQQVISYLKYRAECLNKEVQPNLMKMEEARTIFENLKQKYNPTCPLPINRQKLAVGQPYYFTGIINMIIEAYSAQCPVNYNPKKLTLFTKDGFPVRTLSRRLDGAFPDTVNPVAIWEIKEYYYTTTFGSKISDGVFETQLDGMEFAELRDSLYIPVGHYLMVDAYDTWWGKGRSYLCRIVDMLHMGILTEVLFGKEVLDRLPVLVKEWLEKDQGVVF